MTAMSQELARKRSAEIVQAEPRAIEGVAKPRRDTGWKIFRLFVYAIVVFLFAGYLLSML